MGEWEGMYIDEAVDSAKEPDGFAEGWVPAALVLGCWGLEVPFCSGGGSGVFGGC